jgi:hypothetical protein
MIKAQGPKYGGHTWLLPSLEPHILGLWLTMGLNPNIKHALKIISIKKNNLFMCAKMFEIVPNCCQL